VVSSQFRSMVEGVYSVRLVNERISNDGGTFRAAVTTMVVSR